MMKYWSESQDAVPMPFSTLEDPAILNAAHAVSYAANWFKEQDWLLIRRGIRVGEEKMENGKVKMSFVVTFENHPPIRLYGEFDPRPETEKYSRGFGYYLVDYEDGCLWDGSPDFGHHTIDYYVCKSGKLIYWVSYNHGESDGGHDPITRRTFLKTVKDIENYFREIDRMDEWYRVCGKVNPDLIVDSELL